MLKTFITRGNIISVALVSFLLWRQGPEWVTNQRSEGIVVPQKEYSVYAQENKTKFPPDSKVVTIFWASWCSPCKVEMSRLKRSIKSGKIKSSQIVAINPFEEPEIAAKFLKGNPHPFTFIHAPDVTKQLNVTSTPTTIFLDKGIITNRSSGLSLLGIWRAELFLN